MPPIAQTFKEAMEMILAARSLEAEAGPWIGHNPPLAAAYYGMAVECWLSVLILLRGRMGTELVILDIERQLEAARGMVEFYQDRPSFSVLTRPNGDS